jgi:uridine kinase
MVFGTPEVLKSLDAKLNIDVADIYLVPITYLIVLVLFWSSNQISNPVLLAFIGSALMVIALSQTSSVGWYYWGLPLIMLCLKEASNRTYLLVGIWQLVIVLFFFYQSNEITTRVLKVSQIFDMPIEKWSGLIFSLNLVIGGVLIVKILKESQTVGDVYSLSKEPLSIGIAGDSGVGKDRLSNELANLFGNHEVALLLGDDYHLHERGDSTLVTTSHLAPDANDLEALGRDFSKLLKRHRIYVKHYDHKVGRFTLPRKISSAQLIIVNGLHAHLFPGSERIGLKIFLSMDKELRVKFKIDRDKFQRNHADVATIRNSIAIREPDFSKYVEPQYFAADLNFHVSALSLNPLRVCVQIRTRDTAFLYELRNSLNAVSSQPSYIEKSVDGIVLNVDTSNFSSKDAFTIMNQNLIAQDQLFSSKPKFSNGSDGLMALVSLLALSKKMLNRA